MTKRNNYPLDAVATKLKLTKDQKNILHDHIHDQGYGYRQILQIAKELFNK